MTTNIHGKVVVITGGSSGIGEVTARHLASLGAKVMLGARREAKLKSIVDEINAEGGEADFSACDVTEKSDVEALVQKALKVFGRVDVMVNNAGLMAIAPLDSLKTDEWDRMIDINIKGVLYGIAAALPVFRKQESGHFINISSVAGVKVFSPGGVVYSGTKFAVSAITEGLRHEAGAHIRATSIEPGAVASELMHGTTHGQSSEFVKGFYAENEIPTLAVARSIAYAIEQPADVDINEIVIRPTKQEF